jgi:cell division protease FtsH
VTEYGMSEKVGPLSLGHEDPNAIFGTGPRISSGTAEKIDDEINRLLKEAHDQAERLLVEHRSMLDQLGAVLLVVETIDGDDLEAYTSGTKPIPNPEDLRLVEETRQAEHAAAAAVADKEHNRERGRLGGRLGELPPAPPMPTID